MTYRKLVRFSPGLLRISDRLFLSCSLVTLNTWLPRINLGWGFPSLHKVLLCPLVAQMVKNLPAMQETQVGSLGQEDPLEKGMATHSSILAWRISWTEESGGLQSMGSQRVWQDWAANTITFQKVLSFLIYGNQTLLCFFFFPPYHMIQFIRSLCAQQVVQRIWTKGVFHVLAKWTNLNIK